MRANHYIDYTLPLLTLSTIICWHHRSQDGYPVDSANCCLIGIGIGHHNQ